MGILFWCWKAPHNFRQHIVDHWLRGGDSGLENCRVWYLGLLKCKLLHHIVQESNSVESKNLRLSMIWSHTALAGSGSKRLSGTKHFQKQDGPAEAIPCACLRIKKHVCLNNFKDTQFLGFHSITGPCPRWRRRNVSRRSPACHPSRSHLCFTKSELMWVDQESTSTGSGDAQ